MKTTLNVLLISALLLGMIDARGFLTYPMPRRYRGRGGRAWLRRYNWDQFRRMAIEDLPEELPEYDQYCQGIPFDDGSEIRRFNPGDEVNMEWDIDQPDSGMCSIKLVCPGRQFKMSLWRGPCGQDTGKARSQAAIPRSFNCSKGECFITWVYETEANRRYCNCFDIEVPSQPSTDDQPPATDTQLSTDFQPPATDTFLTTDDQPPMTDILSSTDTLPFPQTSEFPMTSDAVPTLESLTNTVIFTSSEISITTMTTSFVELPGSSLNSGTDKSNSFSNKVYQTTMPSLPDKTEGFPLTSSSDFPTGATTAMYCSSDTLIVTFFQTQTEISTIYLTTTCTDTSTFTMPLEHMATIYSTSTCTETSSVYITNISTLPGSTETIILTSTLPPETVTVMLISTQTDLITTTLLTTIVASDISGGSNKDSMVTSVSSMAYVTAEPSMPPIPESEDITTAVPDNVPRARSKYY